MAQPVDRLAESIDACRLGHSHGFVRPLAGYVDSYLTQAPCLPAAATATPVCTLLLI
ncbi:MAG: hypothetical protein ACXV74_00535 [Methylobacter sp.]